MSSSLLRPAATTPGENGERSMYRWHGSLMCFKKSIHGAWSRTYTVAIWPFVALTGSGPLQYELLLRMRDEDGQLILPANFLDVAERVGHR